MPFLPELIAVTAITVLAAISPGPDFAVVSKNAISYGRKTGIYTALGIALGLAVHVTYSLVGIGFIIAKSILLFNIIKYLGAAYLIYIGYQALKSKPQNTELQITKEAQAVSPFKATSMGFLTNALNPKATIFFLSLFTQVISPSTSIGIQLFYGIEIMLIAFVWFTLLSLFLTHSVVRTKISRVQHRVEQVMGVVLIALGIKVALSTTK
jgi:RhtB (resistance to homoserine/threonine) family protein